MIQEIWPDFDRVLFDTLRAKREWGDDLLALVAAVKPFSEQELARFVFEDAWRFLRFAKETGIAVHILSSYASRSTGAPSSERFQRAKVMASGLVAHTRTVHVMGEAKGPYLAKHRGVSLWPSMVFIDDMPEHLESMQRACPGVTSIHLDRLHKGGWNGQVISSLDELPAVLASRSSS